MTRYTKVGLNPTEGQLADLSAGEAVRLSPHHFQGACPLHLTAKQLKGIQAAHKAGKGYTLKLSKAQIAFSMKNGSGLLQDIIRGGIKFVTPYASDFAKNGVGKLVDMASDKAQTLVGNGAQKGDGWADIGKWLGHTAVDGIAKLAGGAVGPKKLKGKGARPAPRCLPVKIQDQSMADMAPMSGEGWADIGKWLGHTAVDGIAQLAGGGVDPAMMAALRQKKVRVGGKGLYM